MYVSLSLQERELHTCHLLSQVRPSRVLIRVAAHTTLVSFASSPCSMTSKQERVRLQWAKPSEQVGDLLVFQCPLYAVCSMEYEGEAYVAIGGGGGRAKSGIPNGFVCHGVCLDVGAVLGQIGCRRREDERGREGGRER